jgi:type IV pilus assembly protein PilO
MASAEEFLAPITNLPKPAKLGIGFGGIVVIVAAVYIMLLSPAFERIGKLETELKKVEDEVKQNRMVLAQLATFQRQAAELEKQLAVLTVKLPTEKDMPPLYRTLSDTAFQTGLAVMLFQPREARVREYFAEVPIVMTAETGYHDLATFFDRLAALPRVVTVEQWKLSGISRTKNPIRADMTLATFQYRPVGAPPAPKPGAKR